MKLIRVSRLSFICFTRVRAFLRPTQLMQLAISLAWPPTWSCEGIHPLSIASTKIEALSWVLQHNFSLVKIGHALWLYGYKYHYKSLPIPVKYWKWNDSSKKTEKPNQHDLHVFLYLTCPQTQPDLCINGLCFHFTFSNWICTSSTPFLFLTSQNPTPFLKETLHHTKKDHPEKPLPKKIARVDAIGYQRLNEQRGIIWCCQISS